MQRVNTHPSENTRTKEPATHVTLAFYISSTNSEVENHQLFQSVSRLLVERFLGLLSFFAGTKLSAVNIQFTTRKKNGNYSKTLPVSAPTSTPPIIIEFPADLEDITPTNDVFSALFWLRRGLSERDPLESFSALMVCLQIMARHIVRLSPVVHYCPSCGVELKTQEPSITSLTRELVVSKLGATKELFDRVWKARNAIVAHGNQPVTAEVFVELTELKFDAVILAFQSIKLSLGIPLDSPPLPDQALFVTDAFMYVD